MSASTSRPRVRAVSFSPLSASALLAAGAVILTGRALATAIRAADRALAGSMDTMRTSTPVVEATELRSVARSRREQLAAERRVLAASLAPSDPVEVLKVSVLAGLDAAAFAAPPALVEKPLRALASATTAAAVEAVRAELRRVLETSHVHVMSTAIAEACREASLAVGFSEVDVRPGPVSSELRVIATDVNGRALVSEVRIAGDGVGLETEVVGVTDGSCGSILDAFDTELEARGVRADRTRSFTGGACRLAAAKESAGRLTARSADSRKVRRHRSQAAMIRSQKS